MSVCVVTGCAGFIGSHLTERLLSLGHFVIGIDNFTDYYAPSIKKNNISEVLLNPNFELYEKNILDLELDAIISSADYIFHLSAQPGVRNSWGLFFETYLKNNVLCTQKLLESVKNQNSIKKFVYASSSSVYGEINKEKVCENDNLNPYSPYGVTKLSGENLCSLYQKNYDLPIISLRFFTVYGPRQRPDMAFYKIINAGLNKTEFTIYGKGTQKRDFTYISDTINGVVSAGFAEKVNGIFNIASGRVLDLKYVIELVENILGEKIKIKYLPAANGDVTKTGADISKSMNLLDYNPIITLEKGIEQQINYFKNKKDNL